ncbi:MULTISPECIES: extracellular solute-binding protein [Streptomyces]|jgi:raffinose/stachyose/melibiose transport system substrate-binding protein|uniref:Extracellular solute-binding protein n=1 Tax=Streptomyces doudnae TaxID=3075536 RepID=A0ABD5EP25_9ACTN|nr:MULTISPECIES: extracellular solute-binding protein [unclassified Streptomyces]MDT0435794.1 extracellular solute-binding protein [Streptomyces sp. DSM 41981]MYQ62681.1 extracellular solute-binding protein [Streptomyces sp. SID4950]SCD42294.1 raffinose/stachyose/melibiose transport system substrate-binding protein [Streptomyces sp. SolWspMP-5a-2]
MSTARRRTARRLTTLTAAALSGALLLSACGGSDSGSGDAKTLRLWHYEGPDSAMGVAWNAAIKEFEAQHPGVKVKFEEKGFEQIQKTAPMVLNSSDAPDLMEYNKGNATAGQLSRQGLLTDLSAEVKARGWDRKLSTAVATTSRYDTNGVMGSGAWYGVPDYAEYTMVFYNKDLFAKYGIARPTTFGELTAAMDAFVKKGVTPLANAGAEYVAQQYLYQLALSRADRSWVDSYELYKGKTDFHDAAWTYAARTFADWVKKGYLGKKTTGAKAEDAGVSWIQGKAPILFSGSWWYGRFGAEAKFDWDTGLWPDSKLTLGSGGNLWVVPKKARNKQLAYDFIDITLSKKIQNLLGDKGGVPVAADASAVTDPRSRTLIENFNTLSARDGLAFYPDWPVNGFYDVLVSETQKLMTGAVDPDGYLSALQKAYDKGVPQR